MSAIRLTFAALALAVTGACDEGSPLERYHVSLLSYHYGRRLVFTGASGEIQVFRASDDQTSNGLQFVKVLRQEDVHRRMLRIVVDEAHDRLWVVNTKSVRGYAIPTFRPIAEYVLPDHSQYARFADLAVDMQGNVYVLGGGGARIYRIDGQSLSLSVWLDMNSYPSNAPTILPNRFLRSPDGRLLIATSPNDGQLLRIDIATKAIDKVLMSPRLNFTCALLFWNDRSVGTAGRQNDTSSMTALDCRSRWEAELEFSEDFRHASMRDTRGLRPTLAQPSR